MTLDITDVSVVKQIINDINTPQNIERKKYISDSHRILDGSLEHFVQDRINCLFKETGKFFRISDTSVTKKVINTKAQAYKNPPIRKLTSESEDDFYKQVSEDGGLNKAMWMFDRTFNLDYQSCLWVDLVDQDSNKFIFRNLDQSKFDRVFNSKTGETDVFIISTPHDVIRETIHGDSYLSLIQDEPEDADELEFYAMWTKENHVVAGVRIRNGRVQKIQLMPISGNEDMINPIGVIPAVFLQRGDEFSVPERNPLPNNDVEINACKSVMLTGCDIQSLGKLVIKYPESQSFPKTVLDSPFSYLGLPQIQDQPSTDAEYINPNSSIDKFQEVINDYERSMLEENEINAQAVGNASFTSGMDRALAMKSVTDCIEKNQMLYAKVENDVYSIVKAFMTSMNSNELKSDNLRVIYRKDKPLMTDKEVLENIKMKLEMGIIESWEKHIIVDPNLTEAEAREREAKIQAEKALNMNAMFSAPVSEDDNADIEQ